MAIQNLAQPLIAPQQDWPEPLDLHNLTAFPFPSSQDLPSSSLQEPDNCVTKTTNSPLQPPTTTMTQPKTYFLAPDFDCPPETVIKLGHILISPLTPYESLNSDSLLPIPPQITITTTKTGFVATRSQLRSGKFGIWAQVLEGAFGGAALGFSAENSEEVEFAVDELETTFIQPAGEATKEYLRKSLEGEGVRAYFEGSRFRKSVYMIVGLKIAKGAKISTGSKGRKEGLARVMLDGTAAGVPVSVGPDVGGKVEREEGVEWRDKRRFVFAYRVRKVSCRKGKMVKDEAFNKGAFLDVENKGEGREDELYYVIGEEYEGVETGEGNLKFIVGDDDDEVFIQSASVG